MGNRSGQPYILQTNVFTGGKGNREQRIYLWFDPTKDFHEYSILWNMDQIAYAPMFSTTNILLCIHFFFKNKSKHNLFLLLYFRFFVDDVPIRVFRNSKDLGVRYPFNQPMKIYSSLWNADDWATRGGLEKTNWNKAPFVAAYKGFHIDGCEASVTAKFCDTQGKRWWDQKAFRDLDGLQYRKLSWVRNKFTIYNYCTDRTRASTIPPECKRDRDI